MREEVGNRKQEVAGRVAPVRGTQTFVGVMAAVWGRPSLMGLEVLWRWLAGAIVLALGTPIVAGSLGMNVHLGGYAVSPATYDLGSLKALTVFQPAHAITVLRAFGASIFVATAPYLRVMLPLSALVWLVIAAVGRTVLLRRLDRSLCARPVTMLVLGTLRAMLLGLAWWAWIALLGWALQTAVVAPTARNEEASLVLFAAIVICGTLLLYVLWGAVSWPFQLAPLLAMLEDKGPMASLSAALRAGPVRNKLMEVNLVMNIVKLALIVLAMVLSASPLAFSAVATEGFFAAWWGLAILLYFVASDYFHVVRMAAYLRLWRAYEKMPAT